MTTHTNCTHPATKAARAACRRLSAKGYDQLHPAFDPPKPANRLEANGWTRITDPTHRQDCGMPGPTTGFCARNARWTRPGNGAMCAQHAAEVTAR